MTITIPPKLAERLAAAAARYNMPPETLALEAIRLVAPAPEPPPAVPREPIVAPPGSMLEFLAPYIGVLDGGGVDPDPRSDSEQFAHHLVAKHLAGR